MVWESNGCVEEKWDNKEEIGRPYVRVMERRPPPAPARAWATLSVCWAVVVGFAILILTGTRGWSMKNDLIAMLVCREKSGRGGTRCGE